jgi:3-oxoacyl-[acyl-carrier protein] reductase
MADDLRGKNALITGGSRGIGRAIAEALAARGAAVAVNYRENEAAAQKTVAAIVAQGGTAISIIGNVAVVSDIYRMFDEVEGKLGKLDIVVSNAATVINKPMIEYTLEDYNHTFDTNTRGAFFILQQAAARVRTEEELSQSPLEEPDYFLLAHPCIWGAKGQLTSSCGLSRKS